MQEMKFFIVESQERENCTSYNQVQQNIVFYNIAKYQYYQTYGKMNEFPDN